MKKCTKCKEKKEKDNFNKDSSRGDGLSYYCKPCAYLRNKKYMENEENKKRKMAAAVKRRAANPERFRAYDKAYAEKHYASRIRFNTIKYKYGITKEQWLQMFEEQSGKCAGCGAEDIELVVDHDHSCCPQPVRACGNCARGLLCHGCNRALGSARDNPDTLRALAGYLDRSNGSVSS